MKLYNLIIILASLLQFCVVSCKEKKLSGNLIFDDSKLEEVFVRSKKIYFEEVKNPWKIDLKAPYIFVMEGRRVSPEFPVIHIIDAENMTYYRPKGKRGFGPGELPTATLFEPGMDKDVFRVYSALDKKVSEFTVHDSSMLAVNQYKQPDDFYSIINMRQATDSTYLGISSYDPNRLVEFHKNGQRMAGYGEWEKIDNHPELNDFHLFDLNSGWFKGDRELGLYVKACMKRDRLEIFDYKSKKFTVIDGPDLDLPDFEIVGPKDNSSLIVPIENPYRYRDVAITKNHIFALYGGINEMTYRETGKLAEKIFVFSHKGGPVKKLVLDRSIEGLVVNEEKGEMYGLTTDVDPGIAIFKLPEGLY